MSILLTLKSVATSISGSLFRSALIADMTTIETEANRVAAKLDAVVANNGAITAAGAVTIGGVQRTTWPAAGGTASGLNDVLANGATGALPAAATKFEVQDDTGGIVLTVDKATGAASNKAGVFMMDSHVTPKSQAMCIDLTASATVGGLTAADNANLDMGTNNFALAVTVALPDYTPAADVILCQKTDGTNGYKLSLLTTGILRLTINATNYDSTVATGLTDGVMATLGAVVTRESATAAGSVVFKVTDITKGASVAITAGAPTTVDNASAFYIGGTATTRFAMRYKSCRVFNRALTNAQWVDFVKNGVAFADIGANQTVFNVSSCANYNMDVFSGASSTGFHAENTTGGAAKEAATADEILYVAGKNYIASFDLAVISGATPNLFARDAVFGTVVGVVGTTIIPNAHNEMLITATATVTGVLAFWAFNASSFTVSNLRIVKAGATANYDPIGIQPNQVHDSANDNHMSFPSSGASLSMWKETGQYNWTTPIAADTTLTSFVPAGYGLEKIVFKNSTAGAVSVRLGTTAGGVDLFALTALNTSATFGGHKTVVVNQGFSATAAQTLYLSSTDWTGGGTPPSLTFTAYFRRIS